jgi:hypothetical protein
VREGGDRQCGEQGDQDERTFHGNSLQKMRAVVACLVSAQLRRVDAWTIE